MNVPALRFPEFEGKWENCELGETILLQSGYAFASEHFAEEGRKLVTPKNFTKTGAGSFTASNTKYTSEQVDEKFVCSDGDLLALLTDLTPSCELLGKPLELTAADGEVLLNQRIVRIDPVDEKIQKGFLKAFMLRDAFHVRMFTTASGTTVRHSSNKVLRETPISLPSLPEQKKIAAFLGVVDAKIAALRARITVLERYKRGLMQALFSQTLRFTREDGTAFPNWEDKRLGEVCSFIKDGTHGTHNNDPEGEFWLLSAKNIQNGGVLVEPSDRRISEREYHSISKNYSLQSGDILLSIVGTIGRVALFDGRKDVAFQRSVAFFRTTAERVQFLFHFMNGVQFQRELDRRKVVSAQPGIYLGDLARIEVPIPHPEEQAKIADALSAMDAKIAAVTGQLDKMKDFKKGLLQQMFV